MRYIKVSKNVLVIFVYNNLKCSLVCEGAKIHTVLDLRRAVFFFPLFALPDVEDARGKGDGVFGLRHHFVPSRRAAEVQSQGVTTSVLGVHRIGHGIFVLERHHLCGKRNSKFNDASWINARRSTY